MKFHWATDIHLDHLKTREAAVTFLTGLSQADNLSGVFLTGDISDGEKIVEHLKMLNDVSPVPVYFILGNHDFYGASIGGTRAAVYNTFLGSQQMRYLTASEPIELSQTTVLVGHDGWYDFGYGQARPIRFLMSDWQLISEYALTVTREYGRHVIDDERVITRSRALATAGGDHIKKMLTKTHHKNVIILTHVPPFDTAAKHLGKPSEPHALPVFASRVLGDALILYAAEHPDQFFTVYCGHTHDRFDGMIAPNLRCVVGHADYGHPMVNIIEVE